MFFQLHQHAHNYSRQKVWHKSTSERLAKHVEQMNCMFPQLHCMFPQLHCMFPQQHQHVEQMNCMFPQLHCMFPQLHCMFPQLHCMFPQQHQHVEQMNCMFPQLHCMFPQQHQHVHVVYRKCYTSRPAKGWRSSCLIGTWQSLRCACCSNLCGTICWPTTRSRSVWWRDRWPTWRRASSSSASPASWSTPPTL